MASPATPKAPAMGELLGFIAIGAVCFALGFLHGYNTGRPDPPTWGSLTYLRCPFCGNNMVERGLAIQDNDDGVMVRCGWCDHTSVWNFDCPAPFPVEPRFSALAATADRRKE